jgi:1-acyl-sn-glycerol-3-phosphate acyltransferase
MTFCYAIGYVVVKTAATFLFSLRVLNRDKAQIKGPVIYAMNHQSNVDPPLIGLVADRVIHWLGKRDLIKPGFVGWLMKEINVIPVSLDKPDMSGLKNIISLLKEGRAVAIFPEGQRAWDGQLQAALPGLGLVIAKTGAPVVPLRIWGADAVMRRGTKKINFKPITIAVGEPLHIDAASIPGKPREAYQAIADRVMEAIAAIELPPEEARRFEQQP